MRLAHRSKRAPGCLATPSSRRQSRQTGRAAPLRVDRWALCRAHSRPFGVPRSARTEDVEQAGYVAAVDGTQPVVRRTLLSTRALHERGA
eukprot:scaffold285375_cov31-Tisochrysis_lutea.AAC.5